MLHDAERNEKYYAAIRQAVLLLHSRGKKVNVLDIGTGTGLLSMMAVRAGADKVTACEAFKPMAQCAGEIIKKNGCEEKITLIPKRSTELTVGPDGDMTERANLLVTEVFDTELIGEGAIGTYTHAHAQLLEDDCIVVPGSSTVYAQPVHSSFISKWNQIPPVSVANTGVISPPPEFTRCGGAPSLHDLQLSQIPSNLFTVLSEPHEVFWFDFSKKNALKSHEQSETRLTSLADGQVDAIFMWWDLVMDPKGEITLSCAPQWVHPDKKKLPWRDHWMQAIYYPSVSLPVRQNETFHLVSCHDEYSLWFDVFGSRQSAPVLEHPVCTCGLHVAISRTRLGMMGDDRRMETWCKILKKHITDSSVCVSVGDGCLLPLLAAKLGAKQVFAVERNISTSRVVSAFIHHNGLEKRVKLLRKPVEDITEDDLDGLKIDLVMSEPYFTSSLVPWHNLYYHYAVGHLAPLMSSSVTVLPVSMTIKAVGMQFSDLWKIRAPVGNCEGFDLHIFDQLIQNSRQVSDVSVEPQPLWEYPGKPLTQEREIISFDFTNNSRIASEEKTVTLTVNSDGTLNGVALWTEYDMGEDSVKISTGPTSDLVANEFVRWDCHTRQGVHLLPQPKHVRPGVELTTTLSFNENTGDCAFTFHL
ncbi:protein arginine N-methyltransferase 7-like isoform X2 [Gigantopelta aegis]|nr:protein arginine N-methyltransferase 7-like isoform X2 [Gigantopelta aegis]